MRHIASDAFCQYRFIGRLRASAGGSLAYILRQPNLAHNRYDANIWLYRDGREVQLTSGDDAAKFWWQGEQVVFTRSPAAKSEADRLLPQTQLWRVPTLGPGAPALWQTLEGDVEDIVFLPDGRFVYTAKFSPAAEAALLAEGGERDRAAARLKEEACVRVIDQAPFWDNGGGYKRGCTTRLYLWDAGEASALTGEGTEVELVRAAADGESLYYTAAELTDGVYHFENRLYRLDLRSLHSEDLSLDEVYNHENFAPLTTGELVVLGSDMREYGVNQNGVFTLLRPGGTGRDVLDDSGLYTCGDTVGSDLKYPATARFLAEGTDVYWVSTLDTSSHVMRITREGEVRRVTRAEGAVQELALAGGALYYTAMRGAEGPELYTLAADGEVQLTSWNKGLADAMGYTQPQRLDFRDAEGSDIHGFVLHPHGREEGESYPAVLYIHGGPKTVYGPVAFHEMQCLASRGWAVLQCNPTGSDGQGNEFADLRGRYGLIDYDNLMTFLDEALLQNPWIDPLRLAVCGGSYGGFMTNWIIGHNHRFKAAVSQRGIANWCSMQLLSDIGPYFVPDQTGADPWHSTQALWEQSPLCYAEQVSTPTLFLHSDEDYRCPLPEAMQMYTALKMRGVDTRLVVFKQENHELSRTGSPKQRVRRLEEIFSWLERHV